MTAQKMVGGFSARCVAMVTRWSTYTPTQRVYEGHHGLPVFRLSLIPDRASFVTTARRSLQAERSLPPVGWQTGMMRSAPSMLPKRQVAFCIRRQAV